MNFSRQNNTMSQSIAFIDTDRTSPEGDEDDVETANSIQMAMERNEEQRAIEFLRQNFKRKECTCFIRQKDQMQEDAKCHCGANVGEHDQTVFDLKIFSKNQKVFKTFFAGSIERKFCVWMEFEVDQRISHQRFWKDFISNCR